MAWAADPTMGYSLTGTRDLGQIPVRGLFDHCCLILVSRYHFSVLHSVKHSSLSSPASQTVAVDNCRLRAGVPQPLTTLTTAVIDSREHHRG
jgi:hypothetical protein